MSLHVFFSLCFFLSAYNKLSNFMATKSERWLYSIIFSMYKSSHFSDILHSIINLIIIIKIIKKIIIIYWKIDNNINHAKNKSLFTRSYAQIISPSLCYFIKDM